MARVNVIKTWNFFFFFLSIFSSILHTGKNEEEGKQRKRARVFTPRSTYTTANRKVTGITATFQSIDLFNMIIPRGFSWLIFLLLFADKSLSNLLDFFFFFLLLRENIRFEKDASIFSHKYIYIYTLSERRDALFISLVVVMEIRRYRRWQF